MIPLQKFTGQLREKRCGGTPVYGMAWVVERATRSPPHRFWVPNPSFFGPHRTLRQFTRIHPASSFQPLAAEALGAQEALASRSSTNGPFLHFERSFLSKYNYLYVNMPRARKNVASNGQRRFPANPLRNQSFTHSFSFACDQSPAFSYFYTLPLINEKPSPLESGDYTLPTKIGGGGAYRVAYWPIFHFRVSLLDPQAVTRQFRDFPKSLGKFQRQTLRADKKAGPPLRGPAAGRRYSECGSVTLN